MSTINISINAHSVHARAAGIPRLGHHRLRTNSIFLAVDLIALAFTGIAAVLVRHIFAGQYALTNYTPLLGALPVFLLMYALAGLYPGIAMHPVDELRRVAYATTAGYLIVIAGTFMTKAGTLYSRLVFVGAWVLGIAAVVVLRNLVRSTFASRQWWGIPIIVFGAGNTGRRFVETLLRNPSLGLRPFAMLDDDPAKHCGVGANGEPPVLGELALAPSVAREYGIRYAAVAMPSVPTRQLAEILHRHAHQFPHFLLVPDFFGIASVWVTARDVGGIFGLEIQQNLIRRVPQMTKRAFDLVLVSIGGTMLLPLFAVIAILVKATSRGPVLYSQSRIGKDGKEFSAWKFRSMVRNADEVLEAYLNSNPELAEEWRREHKLHHDPRVTAIGRLLRKTSLDELPQLWNVLTGEMSLVGPRPIVRKEIPKYAGAIDLYLRVRPGITGLWQVSGRSNTSYAERVQLDEYYVRNWSVWLDLFVLGKTVRTVLQADGAC
jgi:Undecaprenyl-phosphate galactose phosphotransferase WbaP